MHNSGTAILTQIPQLLRLPLDRMEIKVHGQGWVGGAMDLLVSQHDDACHHRAFCIAASIAAQFTARREELIKHLRCDARPNFRPGGYLVPIFE